ncbi:hypothetical protein [Salinarimonas soli]|uniref:Uncharacterized protein n=1 Tax=Salinarimonas soli TaxID=1638099 RepID=A0A5B2VG08_9HYPH|nr:hypothetical protein [Salinarimonas soli]KAA2237067.1 hypothetical protein F0L46_11420 [Salinarimonas soli]
MADHIDEEIWEITRERSRNRIKQMDAEELTAYIARALACGAFEHDALPEDLRQPLHATIDDLADERRGSPEQVAIEAFRWHGYRAEMSTTGELSLLRAMWLQG